MKIDLGCGNDKKEGFYGLDIYPWPNVDKVCDILAGIPLASDTVDEIYSGHFFEHLPKLKVPFIIGECYRVLKPGGTIDIIVPDLVKVMQNFLNNLDDGWQLDTIFGGQAHDGEYHKTGYWPAKLNKLFYDANFQRVEISEMFGWGQPCLEVKAVK